MGRGLDDLFGLILLLVEHVLVLHREVVAVTAGHRVAKGFPLQGQLPGADVHNLHVLRAVHRVCKTRVQDTRALRVSGSGQWVSCSNGGIALQTYLSHCLHDFCHRACSLINIFLSIKLFFSYLKCMHLKDNTCHTESLTVKNKKHHKIVIFLKVHQGTPENHPGYHQWHTQRSRDALI